MRDLELGDKKPSFLLREMQQLSGNQLSEDILKNLWLQRLPSQVQAILTTSTDSLSRLATMADKINEVNETNTIATVSASSKQCNCRADESYSVLELQIASLTKAVEELSRRGRSYDRNGTSQRRARSKSREDAEMKNGLCYYHAKFKDQARTCKGSWCKRHADHYTEN